MQTWKNMQTCKPCMCKFLLVSVDMGGNAHKSLFRKQISTDNRCVALLRPGPQSMGLVPRSMGPNPGELILWSRSQCILYCIIPTQWGSPNNLFLPVLILLDPYQHNI